MKIMSIGKMLEKADGLAKKTERIEFLRENWSPALGIVLRLAYDPTIEWELPAGRPEFKANDVLYDMETALYNYVRKMYIFVKGPNTLFTEHSPNLLPYKRQKIFIDVLENLPIEDAELIIAAKDRTLPHSKRLTAKFIDEVFPGLLNLPVEKKEPSPIAIPTEQFKKAPEDDLTKTVDYNA